MKEKSENANTVDSPTTCSSAFIVIDIEAEEAIDEFPTLEDAKLAIKKYEQDDSLYGIRQMIRKDEKNYSSWKFEKLN